MFPHNLDEDSYPKDSALRDSKMTLQCYDDSKLVNHGTITLRLKHYSKDSFQDHQFFVVETPTRKEIIIGHPASVRLGLIQVLCKNHAKTMSSIKADQTNNLFRVHNIDGKTRRSKRSSSEPESDRWRKSSESTRGQNEDRWTNTSPKHQTEHPYGTNNHIQSNSSSFQVQNPWQEEKRQNKLISRPLIQSMMKQVRELNSKYYLLTNEQTQIVSEPARALRDRPQGESAEVPLQALQFNPIYMEPGSVRINSTRDLHTLYPNSFDRIGDMYGEYDIKTDPSKPSVQHGRCKVPIEHKAEIKKELNEMVHRGIIVKQTELTPWVNSLTYPKKPNGKLRICLDPKDLNKAIIQERHKAPTLEEITHVLTGVTKFSKVDGNKAFFRMHLTKRASLLTTFNMHLGRYRFLRVPFGLKMSQDIFQMRMDDIVAQCPGVLAIHDDVFIYGKDDNDHDANLVNLFNVAQKEGLVFNSTKCAIKQESVTCFGGIFSAKGYSPDPGKIQGISDMPAPQTKQELQSFLGAMNYLQTFVLHLSHHTELLRVLLKKENMFAWDQNANDSFQRIKGLLKNSLLEPLRYYDRNRPVIWQCDTLLKGLGACILQDSKPIAFASKSLTDTKTRYTNIERELLAIVFGCEKFHTYLYSRSFVVESDHKPLEMICLKNLISAPVRLQRMLLRLQKYDMVIMYWPGKEMLLADALSHLPLRANNTEIKLDLRVDAVSFTAFSSSQLTKTAMETQKDLILSTVHRLTLNGWPWVWRHIPRVARSYWDFWDELSIEGDLLMKGERIVIPTSCRDSILADLHSSHKGANRSLSLAKMCVYWPGMEADVMDYIRRCVTCINNAKIPVETLHPHEVPAGPWIKIGMDFFQDDSGQKFLIVTDYFSKFPFIFPVASTHHQKTLRYLRDVFLTEGVPAVVMTDNGPPFNGEEFRWFTREFDFKHQTSSPHFHQSNGFIEAMVKKVKAAYKKMDGSPNTQARALLQLRDTPIAKDLPSPVEILHGRPAQGAVMPRCHRPVNILKICWRLLEIQQTQKEHFNRAHRAKDERVLKVKEQVRFFPQKQFGTKLKWLTGTVIEILEQGCSYIIEGPNSKKYRRNRAHLKPLCHDGMSFQDPPKAKRQILTRRDNVDSFQDPRPKPSNELHSGTGQQLSPCSNTQLKPVRRQRQNLHLIHLIVYIHPIHHNHHHQHSSHPENI